MKEDNLRRDSVQPAAAPPPEGSAGAGGARRERNL